MSLLEGSCRLSKFSNQQNISAECNSSNERLRLSLINVSLSKFHFINTNLLLSRIILFAMLNDWFFSALYSRGQSHEIDTWASNVHLCLLLKFIRRWDRQRITIKIIANTSSSSTEREVHSASFACMTHTIFFVFAICRFADLNQV